MAFTLYQSNRQEDLFTLFAAVISHGELPPLFTEKVIIPSLGLGKWLTLQLAELHGIAANLKLVLPGAFLWDIVRLYFPDVPLKSPYRPEVLSWRIHTLLKKQIIQAPSLAPYLGNMDERKRGQLAHQLACLFDQYLVYRPDWLQKWENHREIGLGEDEHWQAALWRSLVKEINLPHRADFFSQLIDALSIDPAKLPSRVLCFGVNNLPPMYFNLLQALSNKIEVHYFVLNPSKENWVEDRDTKEQLRLAGMEDPEALYLSSGHPLLSSWGKLGRDFFARVSELPTIDIFPERQEMPDRTLLNRIQKDILLREVSKKTQPINDHSLSIQSCHSAKREIEVLHDTILHWLQKDPTLTPHDVLVMAPNMGLYQPYIEAVFAAVDETVQLPFSVADKNPFQHSALFAVFFSLLSLPSQRFDVAWVLETISHPAILRNFGLTMDHLPLLRDWVQDVNIRWGRDAQHKASYGLPPDKNHTWREGLERLLLGFILPKDIAQGGPPIFSDRVPSEQITTSQRSILTGFVSLIETLIHYAEHFNRVRTPKDWISEILALLEACFSPDEEEEKAILLIQTYLAQLSEESQEAAFAEKIGINLFADIIRKQIDQPMLHRGFLSRGLTFCDILPMRTIPARIICILGLNEGVFPRQVDRIDMDLMRRHPRAGDRAREADDRYLFLETLLSAKEKLYLSYIGQDIRTNQALPPSVLVDELLDIIDEYYPRVTSAREELVTLHALQPFDPMYFQATYPFQSFHTLWLAVAQANQAQKNRVPGLFPQPLSTPQSFNPLSLDTLLRFYRHPIRFLLQTCLDIGLPWQREEEMEGIPVLLGNKERRLIRQRLLQYKDHAKEILRLEGVLPSGVFGDYPLTEESQLIEAWQAKHPSSLKIITEYVGQIEVDDWQITGSLSLREDQQGILVQSLRDTPLAFERISAWIQHLVLCIARPAEKPYVSQVCGIKEAFCYKHCTAKEASDLLRTWLTYFKQGLGEPLPLFTRTSLHFAERLTRGKTIEEALSSANALFLPGMMQGEGNDPYLFAAYQSLPKLDPTFIEVAQHLLLPLLSYQEKEDAGT